MAILIEKPIAIQIMMQIAMRIMTLIAMQISMMKDILLLHRQKASPN